MLLLTRNSDESIIIDGDIKITVLEVSGIQVKIGIDAPSEVKVYREEVHERMQSEKMPQIDLSDEITCEYMLPPYG